eukprot:GGOE01002243.1.p1 GENE.GGOE01002243.1~~GGOE01002243.1.p1  ORF type:complete len:345 (+),score=17.32 GGOE01002243.1:65-1099(+)
MAGWGKYFIGGLSRETTSVSLKAYFELFGELSDAVVMTKDGRSRGFGFVRFVNPAAVPPNFVTSMHVVDGKQVDVKNAIPEEELQATTGVKKLFIGGLTATTTREHLEQHFGQFGVLTDAVVMETNGRPRGFGFVTFENEEQADMAFHYAPGHLIDGKMVDVKKAEPKGSPNLLQRPAAYSAVGAYSTPATYAPPLPPLGRGIPHQLPSPLHNFAVRTSAPRPAIPQISVKGGYSGAENAAISKIFVGGLAHHTTEDSLYAYFSQFGNVLGCEVMRRDGVPRGFGFVVFSHSSEASLALSQQMHIIDGKQVECKTCQPKVPDVQQGYAPYSTWPQLQSAHQGFA